MLRFKRFISSILVISLINSSNVYGMPGRDPALDALEERTKAGWEKFKFLQQRIIEVTGAKLKSSHYTTKDRAEISGPFMGQYVISQAMARTILSIENEMGDITKESNKGTSPVKKVEDVFFKTDGRHFDATKPMLSPVLENAAYWFYQTMFGEGVTTTSIIIVNNVLIKRLPKNNPLSLLQKFGDLFKSYQMVRNNRRSFQYFLEESLKKGVSRATLDEFKNSFEDEYESHIIQASLGIGEEGLDEFIEKLKDNPQRFNELNRKSISIHFLSSLLLNLSDAKGDNFRVDNGSIIGIDNDRFFVPDIFRQKYIQSGEVKHKVGVRSIFCGWKEVLDVALEPQVQSIITSLNPIIQIFNWLYQLQLYDNEFIRLRKEKVLEEKWFHKIEYDDLDDGTKKMVDEKLVSISAIFPLSLSQPAIYPMLQRLEKLQSLLEFSNNITLKAIIGRVQAHVAEYYNKIIERNPKYTPYKVLEEVYIGSSYESLDLYQYLTEDFMKDICVPSVGAPLVEIAQTIIRRITLQKYLIKDQVAIVNMIGKFSNVLNISKEAFDKSWLTPRLPLLFASQGLSPDGLRLLLSLGHLIDQKDEQNQGLVHKAVLSSTVDLDNAIALLDFLKKMEVDFDLQSKSRNDNAGTPLTQAMMLTKEYALPIFSKLIELGAGLGVNYDVTKSFIDKYENQINQDPKLKDKLATLLRRDPKLHWQLSLDKLLPKVGETKNKGEIIQTSNSEERVLSFELEKTMLDSKGNLANKTNYGRRIVNSISTPDGMYGIYFKTFPELPGVEEQVGRLTRNLLGYGAPHTELVRYKNMPVLLSQAILGENLQDVLSKNPDILKKLDHKNLSGMILLSILVNPEDGKPDNFIVEPAPGYFDKHRLVCVDNDHAFVQAVAKEQKTEWFGTHDVIQVRSILYCLDQMHIQVHQEIRDLFKRLDPAEVLIRWLSELREVSAMHNDLFNASEMSTFFQKHESFLGMPFKENLVPELYQKFIRLKDALEANKKITHLELLMKLEPLLGRRYIQVLEKPISVKERFDQVDGVFYSKAIAGTYGTVTKSSQMLASMNIPIPNKVTLIDELRRGKGYGVAQAITQLKEAEDQQTEHALYIQAVELGAPGALNDLRMPAKLEETLEKIDFNRISSNNEQALIKFLKSLPNKLENIRILHLKRSKIIVNEDLTHKVLGIGNITILNISGCSNLTQDIFAKISIECPGIKQLLAAGIGNSTNPIREIVYKEVTKQSKRFFRKDKETITEKDITYPYLEILDISDLLELSRERINAPKLRILEANNCSRFNFIKSNLLKVLTLEKVGITNNNLIEEKEVIESLIHMPKIKYYNIEGCYNIQNSSKYKDIIALYNSIFNELGINANDKEVEIAYKELTIIKVIAISTLTNLTSLNLRENKIGYEGAKALSSLTNLTSLELSRNEIGDMRATALSSLTKALSSLTNLTSLDLIANQNPRGHQIGYEGAKALSTLTNLTFLDLSSNKIGYEGAKMLSSLTNLTSLNLYNNKIGDAGAKMLSSLTNLTSLDLSENPIGYEGAKALSSLTNLTYLYLRDNKIGDEGAKALSSLTNLTYLYLRDNKIGDEGAKALSSLTNLTTLNLWNNQIGDEGAKALSSLTNLTSLNLYNNKIGYEGAKALSSLTNLTSLYLSSNQIGYEGAKALSSLTNLTSLYLSSNQIGDEGAKALSTLTNLTTLELWENQIGDEMMKKLEEMVEHNRAKAPPKEEKKTSEDDKKTKALQNKKIMKESWNITYHNTSFILKPLESPSFEINQEEFDKISITKELAIKLIQNNIKLQNVGGRQLQTLLNYYNQANQELANALRRITPTITLSKLSTLSQAQSLMPQLGTIFTITSDERKAFELKIKQMQDVIDLLNHCLESNPQVCKSILFHTLIHFNKAIYNEDGSLDTNLFALYSKITGKPLFIWKQVGHYHLKEEAPQNQLELVYQIPQEYVDPTASTHFLYSESDGSLLRLLAEGFGGQVLS